MAPLVVVIAFVAAVPNLVGIALGWHGGRIVAPAVRRGKRAANLIWGNPATVLVGDVTSLIYNLLGGEITARFLLKVLVVAFIAGSVFWYYLTDIRREE